MTQLPEIPDAPTAHSFKLDHDIKVGANVTLPEGTEITVRKPTGGALRGVSLSALMQADYNALEAIAPRITAPVISKPEFQAMDPADIVQFAGEVMDFLLPKAARPDSPTT